jgi:hypothetical protein
MKSRMLFVITSLLLTHIPALGQSTSASVATGFLKMEFLKDRLLIQCR